MVDETRRVSYTDENGDALVNPTATRRVADHGASPTRRVDDAPPTLRRDEESDGQRLPLGTLAPGTIFCGDYTVERTLHPHETQRPGLYLCQASQGRLIIKVAAPNFPPKAELWQRLTQLEHPHVLRTYRTFEENGYFFEVQEYYTGGSLEERVPRPGSGLPPIHPEWITGVLVPQVHDALKYLHAQDIIHRDIKPANIYLKDTQCRELVLGDFDISAVLEQTRTSRDTQRAAGTWLYTAPEAFPRFVDDHASSRRGRISRSSDYYSLGITIIELLLGTTSLHQCQLPDIFDFYLQGGRVEVPQGVPGKLATLLHGLLVRNRHTRWGAAEVNRWLADRTSDDDIRRIHDDEYFELARASRPYRLRERQAVDLPGLAEAMIREPDIATEDLITADILLNWIGTLDPGIAREIRRDRDRLYLHPEMVLHSAVMRCDPTRPFIFSDGTEVEAPGEWLTQALHIMQRTGQTAENFCTVPLLQQFEVWLRLKAEPEPALADAVGEIQASPQRVRLEEIAFLFQPSRPYFIMRGLTARTPKELVQLTYGNPDEWKKSHPVSYDASYQRWFEGALRAWLRQRGLGVLAAQCEEVRDRLEDDPFAAFETILRLLDPTLPPVQVEVNATEIKMGCTVMHGRPRTYTVRYATRGPGIPFGAFMLKDARPGVQLVDPVLRQRNGALEIVIDPDNDIPSGKGFRAALHFESGIAKISHAPIVFTYRVEYPLEATMRCLLAGAGIGAVLLGLPRLVTAIVDGGMVYWLTQFTTGGLWEQIAAYEYPLRASIAGLLVFLVCLYFGLRIWLWALRRSKT